MIVFSCIRAAMHVPVCGHANCIGRGTRRFPATAVVDERKPGTT
jgi:hypothetical protein